MKNNTIRSIGVFCGSSVGVKEIYSTQAAALGKILAEQKITLVYGAGNVGLMGVIADACLAAGGEVTGVITQRLVDVELAHAGIQKTIVVETMAERKSKIEELSDAFIAMPGGYGTFDELFEVLTLVQLNIAPKAIGLLNTADYFRPFVELVRKGIEERFIRSEHEAIFSAHHDPMTLLDLMQRSDVVETQKWLTNFKHTKF